MAYSVGFDAGFGLDLTRSEGVYTPIGVRGAVYPREAVYPGIAVYDTVSGNTTV
jgi:hypothetical protein